MAPVAATGTQCLEIGRVENAVGVPFGSLQVSGDQLMHRGLVGCSHRVGQGLARKEFEAGLLEMSA